MKDELDFATKLTSRERYHSKWWKDIPLETFEWNDTQGLFHRSYDLFNDGSVELISIPGHCNGLAALKIKNDEGKFVLLFSDGGYAARSWQ